MNFTTLYKAVFAVCAMLVGLSWADVINPLGRSDNGQTIVIRSQSSPLPLAEEAFLSFNSEHTNQFFILNAQANTSARKSSIRIIGINNEASSINSLNIIKKLPDDTLRAILNTAPNRTAHTAAVTQDVLDTLGLPLGGGFTIGRATFVANAVIEHPPISTSDTRTFAVVSGYAFRATHLLGPASNVQYVYHVTVPEGTSASEWIKNMRSQFPHAAWTIELQ